MSDRNDRRRENDSLQSGEGNQALGQDERDFGAGGQVVERALEPGQDDQPHRDVDRDATIPEGQRASARRGEDR